MQRYLDPRFLLRLGPSLVMILFGLNQMYSPQNWFKYIPDWVQNWNISPQTLMYVHAAINVLLGVLLLSGWNAVTITTLSIIWFLSILPFAFMADWTVALRDFAIILSMCALLVLVMSEAKIRNFLGRIF